MEVICNDCKSKYQMTDEELAADTCLVCGGHNIEPVTE
jgi:PHP family Zn ribbon phosphoesterase